MVIRLATVVRAADWQFEADGSPVYRCPECRHWCWVRARLLDSGETVGSLVCRRPECSFSARVRLAGWRSSRRRTR